MIDKIHPLGFWVERTLGDVATIVMGQAPPNTSISPLNGDLLTPCLPFIQGNAEFSSKFPVPTKACLEPLKIAEPGDTLISVRAPVGELNVSNQRIAIGRGLAAIRFTSIDSTFGWYLLAYAKRGLERKAQGSTFEAIGGEELRKLRVSFPPLPEQRAIAAILDSIDEAIERTEEVIAATEELRKALLHDLLTRGVPGWHTEWKEVPGIGTIPADWEVVKLEDVAEVERGKFGHRPRNDPRFYGGEVPFIQTGDVVAANGRIRTYSQTLNERGLSVSKVFPKGTIVITIAANIGETGITQFPVAFPDSLVGIIPRGIETQFLEYFLRKKKRELQWIAPSSAQKNLNLEALRPLPVPVPGKKEQETISSVLIAIDNRLEEDHLLLNEFKRFRLASSEALLSGSVRMPIHKEAPTSSS